MKLLINYASERFFALQQLNCLSGETVGGFDAVRSFGPADLDADFRAKNAQILTEPRGGGYWLWKPYFIQRTLAELSTGDFLFYSDSGAYFLRSIDPLVEIARRDRQDVIPFELPLLERAWTKRDTLILMNATAPRFMDTRQRLASFVLFRVGSFARDFVAQWLEYGQDARLITDQENTCGEPNHPDFREHRHDQSIFSLLTKRHGLRAYRSPAKPHKDYVHEPPGSDYGVLLRHRRSKRPLKHHERMRFALDMAVARFTQLWNAPRKAA